MKKLITLVILMFLSMPVAAGDYYDDYETGKFVVTLCKDHQIMCYGFIAGVIDTSQGKTLEGDKYCFPKTITIEQATKVAIKYLNENPKLLHLVGASLIQKAFVDAFPCPK